MADIFIFFPASVIVFALGASVGSFINVVIYRLPNGLSILYPPSRCPHCLNQLKAYDNVPVMGWLWLKGRCRFCKNKISIRYPVVEAVTGVMFLVIFWAFKFSLLTIGYWVFCSWLLALSAIDLDTMILPNTLTRSGLVLGIIFQIVIGFVSDSSFGLAHHILTGIVGAVVGLWLFGGIGIIVSFVLGKTALGGGDPKLAAMMGAWLGWRYLLLAIFIASAIGALFGVVVIIISRLKKVKRKPEIKFGPFLALGSIVTLFVGNTILSAYLRLIFRQ